MTFTAIVLAWESAAYGVCASQNLKYFGYKLACLSTLDGLPVICELVPASLDERESAEAILFADNGFIGVDLQSDITAATGTRTFTPKRRNQHDQNTPAFDRWLNGLRADLSRRCRAISFHIRRTIMPACEG